MDATDQLILHCANTNYHNKANQIKHLGFPQLLKDDIDWERFVTDVSRHGLLPLMHQILLELPETDGLPPKIRERLHHNYVQELARTMLLNRKLEKILVRFAEAHLPVIVLKGPFLSEKVYSQKNIRSYCDLDLLVKDDNVPLANSLLHKLDYQLCPERARFYWEQPYPESVFVQLSSGSLCEIHWNILDKRRFLPAIDEINAAIWKRATKTELFELPILTMTPEHLLIHLCLHLAIIHRFGKLILYRDLAEVSSFFNTSFDWDYFIQCVDRWHIKSQVYYPLRLAKELFGAEIPPHTLGEIRPRYLSARLFEAALERTDLVSLPQYGLKDILFLTLRDRKVQRYKSTLALPYRTIRWCLKGNTC